MKKIVLVLLCLIAQTAIAQIKFEGVVKDTLNKPLELANVIALNKGTNTLESYGITNNEGRFRLSLKKNTTYLIKVSYIGLATIDDSLTTKEADITKDFIMKSDNSLDAVELTYEMPVTIKGDTIVYNADSFKNGSEKKLGDVLKKLPGVEVDDEGEIKVEGKSVTKVMVEGKEFEVFNFGKMSRDFTYVADIIESVKRLIPLPPKHNNPNFDPKHPNPSISSAPYQLFNVGNNSPVALMDYVQAVEEALGKKGKIVYKEIQPGDVPSTYADVQSLYDYIDFKPSTTIKEGIQIFVDKYLELNKS